MEKVYADALLSALTKGENEQELVTKLVKHLEAEGRTKLLPGILRELKNRKARDAKLAPVLEVADKDAEADARAAGIDTKHVVVNEKLISGWRARSGSELTDRSGKRALVEIYRNIVTK